MRPTRLLAVTMVLALGACGVEPSGPAEGSTSIPTEPTTTEDNTGGFGAPSQAPGEFDFGPGKPVNGELLLAENGCWYADISGQERLVVLPVGFEQNPEAGDELLDSSGTVFRGGDRFDAVGSMVPEAVIPGGADGKWGNYMAFCQPDMPELAVFDSFTHEFDPTSLSEAELAEMVKNAEFTEHWGCGRGWATSTSDQRVGLVIYEGDPWSADGIDEISLLDTGWNGAVIVGKNLFSEHCNDAIEMWIALPTMAQQWPLSGGKVVVTDPMPGPDGDPAHVRAVLEGGRIETESGTIQLPRIDLDNRSFNFFAG